VDLDLEVANLVGRVGNAFDAAVVEPVLDARLLERCACENGLAHELVLPAGNATLRVESRLDVMQGEGAVESTLDVVLPRPHQVDRSAAAVGLGDRGDFPGPVASRIAAPTEAAAAEQCVDLDLLRLEPEHLRDHELIDALELTAGPQLGTIVAPPRYLLIFSRCAAGA
jgi:hypothetical protein